MPDLTVTAARDSGRSSAYAMAGVKPADIDVVQLYDAFTITPILFLEDLGFCAKGEGGAFVEDGAHRARAADCRSTPTAAASRACHPGMYGIFTLVEAVRQLRGEAASGRSGHAQVALAHGNGGVLVEPGRRCARHRRIRSEEERSHDPRSRDPRRLARHRPPLRARAARAQRAARRRRRRDPRRHRRGDEGAGPLRPVDPRGVRRPRPHMEEEVLVAFELGHTSPAFRSLLRHQRRHRLAGHRHGRHARSRSATTCRGSPPARSSPPSPSPSPTPAPTPPRCAPAAVRDGDHYVLNGTKRFITNAPRGRRLHASWRAPIRRTRARGGVSAFLVEARHARHQLGKPDRKMGQRGTHTCDVIFDNVPRAGGQPHRRQGGRRASRPP